MMTSDRAEERRRTANELEGTAVQVEWLIPGESPTDVCWYSEVLVLLSPRGRRVSGSVVFFPFQYCILSRAFPFGPGSLPLFRFSAFGEGGWD